MYKMVVNIDGNSVADRLPSQLVTNSVILKQQSSNVEYWYDEIKPWQHYVPVANDLSDLASVVERIRHNDTLLQSISDAATAYVLRNLNPDSCRCYWVQLFKEYSKFVDNVETLPNARRGCPAEQPIV